MISYTCPSCQGKNQAGDDFAGRKLKCPKCGCRVRHHKDGNVELLSVGTPPKPPAPGEAPPAAAAAPSKDSTAVLAAVADKFLTQGEGKQNTFVIWGIVAFLAVVLGGLGLMIGEPLVAVAPPAIALVAAFVWLFLRYKKHAAALKPRDDGKTEPIAKL